MHSHGHIAALSTLAILFFSSSIASADPGPSAYADAKAPFSDEEIASLTLKLEAASAKKSWKKASKLATEKLGEAWCADTIALPFRTFAALGVIARRTNQDELAVTCALRSFFVVDSEVERGQVYFELSLLVGAMSNEQFIDFQKRLYAFPSTGCDQDSSCCYQINEFVWIINSFDKDFYRDAPDPKELASTPPGELAKLRKRSAKKLLTYAHLDNPSPTLAKRLIEQGEDVKKLSRSPLADLPSKLEPLHTAASHKEARAWLLEHAKKSASKIEATHHKKISRGGLSVTQSTIGLILADQCDSSYYTAHYFIVNMKGSSEYAVFQDPNMYYANGCGGYGDDYEIGDATFQKTSRTEAPLFSISSSTSSYINGTECSASGPQTKQTIYCSAGEDGAPHCLVEMNVKSWSLELGTSTLETPTFRFVKGRSDFKKSTYSGALRKLITPVNGVSFMKLYEGLPAIEEQVRTWYTDTSETSKAATTP